MESPQARSNRHCPQCAVDVRLDATDCWLCHAKLPLPDAAIMPMSGVDNARRPLQYGISSLLLVITFAAVLCSLTKMSPGLGIAAAVLTVPAMLRTVLVAFRRRESGDPMSASAKAGIFMLTLAMTVSVIVAAGVAFFVTCLVGVAAGSGGRQSLGSLDWLPLGLTLGSVAALIVGGGLIWVYWKAARRPR